MSKKLDATIVLTASVIAGLEAARTLAKFDSRAKSVVITFERLKTKMRPLLLDEVEKISKEDEGFDDFSNSKTDWIEGGRR